MASTSDLAIDLRSEPGFCIKGAMPRIPLEAATRLSLALVAAIGLGLYAGELFRHISFASGGPDTSGYMNGARAIATAVIHRPVVVQRAFGLGDGYTRMFMPLGMAPSPGARMHPTYPPGLSVHLAAAAIAGGWEWAPYLVAPLFSIAAVVMIFFLARELGLSKGWCLASSVLLAVSPPFVWHAVQPASDNVATFWALVAVCAAIVAQRRPAMAVACGAALGVGVWVRPTNLLLTVPLLFALRFRWPLLIRAAAGALPFGAGIAAWNAAVYGSPVKTGYGTLANVVSVDAFGRTWSQHVETLRNLMTRFLFPTGLAVMFDWRVDGWKRAMLVTWFAIFIVFYSFYGFFDGWLCMRFLMPAVPAVILGFLLLVRDLVSAVPLKPLRWVAGGAAALLIAWIAQTTWQKNEALIVWPSVANHELIFRETVHWATYHLPDNAVVVSGVLSGAFEQYAPQRIVRYDQVNDDQFQMLRAYAGNANLRWYAVISEVEMLQPQLEERLRARWTPVARIYNITLYRLDD